MKGFFFFFEIFLITRKLLKRVGERDEMVAMVTNSLCVRSTWCLTTYGRTEYKDVPRTIRLSFTDRMLFSRHLRLIVCVIVHLGVVHDNTIVV